MKKRILAMTLALLLTTVGSAAFAATSQDTVPAQGDYPGSPGTETVTGKWTAPLTDGDDTGNGIGNANKTGEGIVTDDGTTVDKVIKSVGMYGGNQRTHGEYQNNTNSCASCHQTHTASSKNLLFKDGVYNTCTACHDGTLGFYNVFTGSSAGTFGGTKMGNASVHLATGAVQIKAAPGGNTKATTGSWTGEFNCASCHAPHGSYSDRLLHYNPNNMANTTADKGGQKIVGANVVDILPVASSTSAATVVYKTTAGDVGITEKPETEPVIVVMKKVQDPATKAYSYVRDTSAWLYGYNFNADRTKKLYYTAFKDSAGNELENISKQYGKAYAYGEGVASAATADIAPVFVVKLANAQYPLTEVKDFGGVSITAVDERVYDEAGMGVPIGKYCGACHTDYLAKSGGTSGMWSQAFRHTTNNDSYTCLKCHFAHGTDVEVMKDAKDNTVASLTPTMGEENATNYMLDKNPSSALKRYTNMSVCWKCHTESKASQLKNNSYYFDNYDTVPHGPNNW